MKYHRDHVAKLEISARFGYSIFGYPFLSLSRFLVVLRRRRLSATHGSFGGWRSIAMESRPATDQVVESIRG